MHRMSKIAVGVAVVAATMPAFTSAASAAPVNAKNATPITITCGDVTYQGVVNGGGGNNSNSGQTYNPAHSVQDNSVLQPVAFGTATYSLYVNGQLVDEEQQPGAAKGNGNAVPPNAQLLSCHYTFERSQTDPATGDVYTMVGSGSVIGFIPGSH